MNAKKTPGHRTIDALWPDKRMFDTAWGKKTREGLASCIDELTAAPELLEACKAMLAVPAIAQTLSPAIDLARAAIAKAEGNCP